MKKPKTKVAFAAAPRPRDNQVSFVCPPNLRQSVKEAAAELEMSEAEWWRYAARRQLDRRPK